MPNNPAKMHAYLGRIVDGQYDHNLATESDFYFYKVLRKANLQDANDEGEYLYVKLLDEHPLQKDKSGLYRLANVYLEPLYGEHILFSPTKLRKGNMKKVRVTPFTKEYLTRDD